MRIIFVLMMGVLAGCGGSQVVVGSTDVVVGSCNAVASRGLCQEYRGPVPQIALGAAQSRCTSHGGSFSSYPCPLDGVYGSCVAIAPEETERTPGTSVFGAAYRPEAVEFAQGQCVRAGAQWQGVQ
jgi:hypothetical protein